MSATPVHPLTGTEHDGRCEECDKELTAENIVETRRGFYCSGECRAESDGWPSYDYREDFHADG